MQKSLPAVPATQSSVGFVGTNGRVPIVQYGPKPQTDPWIIPELTNASQQSDNSMVGMIMWVAMLVALVLIVEYVIGHYVSPQS